MLKDDVSLINRQAEQVAEACKQIMHPDDSMTADAILKIVNADDGRKFVMVKVENCDYAHAVSTVGSEARDVLWDSICTHDDNYQMCCDGEVPPSQCPLFHHLDKVTCTECGKNTVYIREDKDFIVCACGQIILNEEFER